MRRLHPSTVVVAFLPEVVKAAKAVLPLLFLSVASGKSDYSELIAPLIGVLSGFGAISAYLTTRYGVEQGHLVCRRGWLFRQDRRIPLHQIQNVNLRQGVLEKLLKVITVEIETAAGTGAELKLQVITAEAAELLQQELLPERIQEEAQPVTVSAHRLESGDLLLGGITENRGMQILFLLLPAIFGGSALRAILLDSAIFEVLPGWVPWALGIGLFLSVLVLGWLWGIASYLLKYGGFEVRREDSRYTIRHGVFTKNQYVVRLSRIEKVMVVSTVWQRLIGRLNLQLGTAGSFGEQGATVPFALMLRDRDRHERLQTVLESPALETLPWRPLPKRYALLLTIRSIVSSAFFGGFIIVPLSMSSSELMRGMLTFALASAVLVMGLSLVVALTGLIQAGYAITDDLIAYRYGYFTQTTTLMPVARMDSASAMQPPFWRRGRFWSLSLKGMVHSIDIPMMPAEDAERVVELLRSHSERRQAQPRPSGQPSSLSYPTAPIQEERPGEDVAASHG